MKRDTGGFTLVELAVALVIVTLLLGGLLMPLSAQMEQKNYNDTRQQLAEAREALLGYAMTHAAADGKPYLPCPDINNDGKEDRIAATLKCSAANSAEGALPWSDLGLQATDAWGNRLHYRVLNRFADVNTGFSLSTPTSSNALTVYDSSDSGTRKTVATGLPLVLLSHGPNGFGALNVSGGLNAAPTTADELANADGSDADSSNDDWFVMHAPVQNDFDDIVVWLPAAVLFNRMVTAGKLP
ncbi:MAG: prepilin-type N-terminal cleavage/methylation domain-containing protein [Rhodocyclaceae bacterium]|nr:prepilin-type N-terminal cleavage/methylation domain-containing protein [Rhodocyclaceae bacterium]